MIVLPDACPRARHDCLPLAQVLADDGGSFVCCGHNAPGSRSVPTDRFRVCFKNDVLDELADWDERDLKDHVAVLAQALSVDANMETQ